MCEIFKNQQVFYLLQHIYGNKKNLKRGESKLAFWIRQLPAMSVFHPSDIIFKGVYNILALHIKKYDKYCVGVFGNEG